MNSIVFEDFLQCPRCGWSGYESELYRPDRGKDHTDGMCPLCLSIDVYAVNDTIMKTPSRGEIAVVVVMAVAILSFVIFVVPFIEELVQTIKK